MADEVLNSLEIFTARPSETKEFFKRLPIEIRKTLEGLEGFELAAAIEELYEQEVLRNHLATLPLTTQKRIAKLAPEEQLAELRKSLDETNRSAYSAERQMAASTAEYVKKNIVPTQQSLFAPYPHDLARRSIFFIEENEKQTRDTLSDFVIGSGPWGLTTYSGKKMFIADEKAWVVLLAMAGNQKKSGVVDWHVVKGSIRAFLREAGLPETGQYSDRFIESIQAMQGGVFRFEGKQVPKSDGKPRKKPLKERVEGFHLVSSFSIDNITGQFVIVLDRVFIETFISEFRMYAKLNIKQFCKQPPTASALHRFFAGHTPGPDGCIRMNLFLVAKSTNMLTEYPIDLDVWPNADVKFSKKRTISRALTRLVQDGTFGPRTGVKTRKRGEDDMVIIDFQVSGKLGAPGSPKKALPQKKK